MYEIKHTLFIPVGVFYYLSCDYLDPPFLGRGIKNCADVDLGEIGKLVADLKGLLLLQPAPRTATPTPRLLLLSALAVLSARRSLVNVVQNVQVIAAELHCFAWTVLFTLLLLLLCSFRGIALTHDVCD